MMTAEILRALLEFNLAASAAIIVVLITRLYVRQWFGGRAAYLLWLLAPVCAMATLAPAREIIVEIPAAVESSAPTVSTAETVGATAEVAPMVVDVTTTTSRFKSAQTNIFGMIIANGPLVLLAVWVAGAICAASLIARRQYRFLKNLGVLELDEVADQSVLRTKNLAAGPAIVGFFRPSIILPVDFEEKFNAQERALVIAHERQHIAAGDAIVNYAVAAALCLCWFNPLVHLAAWIIRTDQEIACDSDVLAHFPEARRTYAEALFKTQLATQSAPVGCAWPAPSVHPLKERIEIIGASFKDQNRRRTGMTFSLAIAILGGAVACVAQPPVQVLQTAPISLTASPTSDVRSAAYSETRRRSVDYETPGVDLEDIAARLIVIPEDRSDYIIEITQSSMLPEPTITREGARLFVNGGIPLRQNPCEAPFNDRNPVNLPGYGSVTVSDVPVVTIRAPRDANITTDGAVFAAIAPTRRGKIEAHGCGDVAIAAATEFLDVSSFGFGNVAVENMTAPVKAFLVGLGDMSFGNLGDADLNQVGVGDINAGDIDGNLTALLHGAGKIKAQNVTGGTTLSLSGADNFEIAEIVGPLEMDISGSGNINIGEVNSPTASLTASGSGNADIKRGLINELKVSLTGSGGMRFGGHARSVAADRQAGAPKIYVGSADEVRINHSPSSGADVIIGQ